MSWIAVGTTAVSLFAQSAGAESAAAGAKANAQNIATEKAFEAEQLRQQAGDVTASSQIAAAEQQRQARMVQGRTLAVAAASGAGVSNPTVVNMLARTAGEGTYRANVALYGGAEKARLLNMQAAAADYEGAAGIEAGDLKAQAIEIGGGANSLAGAASLFSKYNVGSLFPGGSGTPGAGAPNSAGDFPVMT